MKIGDYIQKWIKSESEKDNLVMEADYHCNNLAKLQHLRMRWNAIRQIEDDAEFLKAYEEFKPIADDYSFFEPTEEISRRILKKLSIKDKHEG